MAIKKVAGGIELILSRWQDGTVKSLEKKVNGGKNGYEHQENHLSAYTKPRGRCPNHL